MAPESVGGVQFPKLGEIKKLVEQILSQMKEKGDSSVISRLVDYELKIQALTEENKKLKETLGTANPSVAQETEKIKQELFQLQGHYKTLYDYYQQVTKENEELRAKLASSAAVKEAVRIAELEAAVKKLEEEKRLLKQELEKGGAAAKISELETALKKLYELNRSLKDKLEKAEASKTVISGYEETQKRIAELENENKKLKEEIEKSKSEKGVEEQLKMRIEELEQTVERMRKEADEHKTKAEEVARDASKITELEAELVKKMEEENRLLKQELEKMKSSVSASGSSEDLQKKVAELQKFFEQARQEAEAYRKMAEENRREILRLREVEAEYNKYKDIVMEVKKAMGGKKATDAQKSSEKKQ